MRLKMSLEFREISELIFAPFQKNPQIMYLEQELESLKAVLEIKNEKLHQQDIKLMKMERLVSFLWRQEVYSCFFPNILDFDSKFMMAMCTH